MNAVVTRHPTLQKLHDARRGEPITRAITLAQKALFSVVKYNDVFLINVLKLSLESKVDSIAISKVLGWWLDAGLVIKVGEAGSYYQITDDLMAISGI